LCFSFPRRLASCAMSHQRSALWHMAALERARDMN
jgi:hypothetical protein